MANDKDYSKRTLVSAGEESSAHKKKSKTSAKSTIEKRADHKHDYEQVIIESGLSQHNYYWAKRCKICGRVDDSGEFKAEATEGLVKERKTVKLGANTYTLKVFYTLPELSTKYPQSAILKYNYKKREYEEIC